MFAMAPDAKTFRTHYLFLLIVATVSRTRNGLSVRQIGETLGYPPDTIAHCIALHLYLERRGREGMPIPPPSDYVVPGSEDIITRGMLEAPKGKA
jgi:hypothetical protein